jgi:HAD superfamily hydrolase (TIGR01509 family)
MTLQAVIFDCDGVLVDSETLGNQVLVDAVRDLGLTLTVEQALTTFRGCKMATCVAVIEQWLGRTVPPDFVATVRAKTAAVFRQQLRPIAGVDTILRQIELPFCVASSGPRAKIELSLEVTGLLPHFAGRIFSAYEVGSWKPAPDLFLHAAQYMGVAPTACAVVEDSVPGVQAGRAAGMTVFGFAQAQDRLRLQEAGAYVFDDMQRLPQLLQSWRAPS